jgi:hypothetical protein
VYPREEHMLVLLDIPRLGGPVAVEIDWPDDDPTGTMTGDSAHDLQEWIAEEAIWLDEEIATADESTCGAVVIRSPATRSSNSPRT